jgi:hypothetical protein
MQKTGEDSGELSKALLLRFLHDPTRARPGATLVRDVIEQCLGVLTFHLLVLQNYRLLDRGPAPAREDSRSVADDAFELRGSPQRKLTIAIQFDWPSYAMPIR